ncbi:MAG TPA: hypothetical protein VGE25_02185 [Sediminibacterium sp.]
MAEPDQIISRNSAFASIKQLKSVERGIGESIIFAARLRIKN